MCFCQLKGYFRSAFSCNFLSESYWCAIIANYKSLPLKRGAILAVFFPSLKAIHYFLSVTGESSFTWKGVSAWLFEHDDRHPVEVWVTAWHHRGLSVMSTPLWQLTQYCPRCSTGQHHNMGRRQGVMLYLHNLSPILQCLPQAMTEGLWGFPMRWVAQIHLPCQPCNAVWACSSIQVMLMNLLSRWLLILFVEGGVNPSQCTFGSGHTWSFHPVCQIVL